MHICQALILSCHEVLLELQNIFPFFVFSGNKLLESCEMWVNKIWQRRFGSDSAHFKSHCFLIGISLGIEMRTKADRIYMQLYSKLYQKEF